MTWKIAMHFSAQSSKILTLAVVSGLGLGWSPPANAGALLVTAGQPEAPESQLQDHPQPDHPQPDHPQPDHLQPGAPNPSADQLRSRGIEQARAGDFATALGTWQQALGLYRQMGDRLGEAHTLGNMARAHSALQDDALAIDLGQQALGLYRQQEFLPGQVRTLDGLGEAWDKLGQPEAAIAAFEQALALEREQGNRRGEGYYLARLGSLRDDLEQYDQALALFEQSLAIRREIGSQAGEAFCLGSLGEVYYALGQYQQAIARFEQALVLEQALEDKTGMSYSLAGLGKSYQALGQYRQAVIFQQQSLELTRQLGDLAGEAVNLTNLAIAHRSLGEYELALELHQQALTIKRDSGDLLGTANSLNSLGNVYDALGEYDQAIAQFQASLAISEALGDARQRANSLGNLGNSYRALGQYEQAEALHQQSLLLHRQQGNRRGEAAALGNLANVYSDRRELDLAIELLEQSLAIQREQAHAQGESEALGNLGNAYAALGQLERAIELHQQALAIQRRLGDRQGESASLSNLSNAYYGLSQFERTIALLQDSLAIDRAIGNRPGEVTSLGNLGAAYSLLGQQERAIEMFEQALALARRMGDRPGQAATLGNLGGAYDDLQDYDRAIALHRQALELNRSLGNRQGEASSLSNLGNSYKSLGQPGQAVSAHGQAVEILRSIGDRRGEAVALINLAAASAALAEAEHPVQPPLEQALGLARAVGDRQAEALALAALGSLHSEREQPELAIALLKHAVSVSEAIRADIAGLATDLRQSYTDSIASRYRLLARLLLEQGRIPEAQQVLDLLKLEELREFSQTTRARWTSAGLQYNTAEQALIDIHGDLIAFGQTLADCERNGCEQQAQLQSQLKRLREAYAQQIHQLQPSILANQAADRLFANPDDLSLDAQQLLAANPNSVLIYPLVTADKLWLLYATAGGTAGSSIGTVELEVSQGELAQTVQQFGQLITSEGRLHRLQSSSQQLYRWLIEPLEALLDQNGIEHLIFVNDRVTRYIPMAALFDGDRYLIERYTLSSVLSPALTDIGAGLGPVESTHILGLGLTEAVPGFSPLPAVAQELDNIVRSGPTDPQGLYPGQVHLNEAFDLERLKAEVAEHQVLHIATHADFVPGRPDASYIVLGTGERLKVPELDQLGDQLRNLHLVVLSACQTALGGKAEDGTEIAGLSAYFLDQDRAEAVIASLWAVSDDSTSLLMQHFYALMASGELTKAEALQQAQLSLLYDEDSGARLAAARSPLQFSPPQGQTTVLGSSLGHPYHWAPFILIGNGQ